MLCVRACVRACLPACLPARPPARLRARARVCVCVCVCVCVRARVHARVLCIALTGVPVGLPSRGGDVTVYVLDISQPSSPTPFYSALVSVPLFVALSTVFYSINSPDNSPLSHSVLLILLCLIGPVNYTDISSSKSPSALM